MRDEFKNLRLKQLDKSLRPYVLAQNNDRPPDGWIRAIRQALGISASDLARTLGRSRHLPLQLEKAEASNAITLKSLRLVAAAMDCDLVYALVPKSGQLRQKQVKRMTAEVRATALRVEHSMALENQAVGDVEGMVAVEVRRRLKSGQTQS